MTSPNLHIVNESDLSTTPLGTITPITGRLQMADYGLYIIITDGDHTYLVSETAIIPTPRRIGAIAKRRGTKTVARISSTISSTIGISCCETWAHNGVCIRAALAGMSREELIAVLADALRDKG